MLQAMAYYQILLALHHASCLHGDLPVFSDYIYPSDLQQEVRVPVVGRHPGLAAGSLIYGLHPSLDCLQTLNDQGLPERVIPPVGLPR